MPALHYIPLVVQMLPTTLGENNPSKKTEIQVRLYDCMTKENCVFQVLGENQPKIMKQLFPRTREQVTGCRWLQ